MAMAMMSPAVARAAAPRARAAPSASSAAPAISVRRSRRGTARRGDAAVTAASFTPAGARIAGIGMAVPEQFLTARIGRLT